MGRESKYESVLSWADEVEKEEEEAEAQVHLKQKLNPFGSARPREIVLQERGVDWRKLDLDLQQTSNLRDRNEKQSKENIPAPNARASAKKQCEVPWVPLAPQSQIPVVIYPPLRYPHKNGIPRLPEESSICYNPYGLDNWQQNYRCKNRLEDLQRTELEEAPCNGKRLREPAACKKQQDRSPAYERRRRLNAENLAGSLMLNERRAPLVRQDKRWSLANGRSWKNSQDDDYGRHYRIYCRGADDNRMERTLSAEFEWEIKGLGNGRQKVGGMVISPFTAAAGNGGRVGATQNLKMNIAIVVCLTGEEGLNWDPTRVAIGREHEIPNS